MNQVPKSRKSAVVTAHALVEDLDSGDDESARERMERIKEYLDGEDT